MGTASAEDGSQPTLIRSEGSDGADTPSGKLLLRVPAAKDTSDDAPAVENAQPPAEPGEPEVEDDAPTTFFGEPIGGRFLWVLDVSGSMATWSDVDSFEDADGNVMAQPLRIEVMKAELIKCIRKLSGADAFDIVTFPAAWSQPGCRSWSWNKELLAATPDVRDAAIEYVKNLNYYLGTPSWTALKYACERYAPDMDKILFLSDGAPTPHGVVPQVITSKDAVKSILRDFPDWFAPHKAKGCVVSCVQFGEWDFGADFMGRLAGENGGEYRKFGR